MAWLPYGDLILAGVAAGLAALAWLRFQRDRARWQALVEELTQERDGDARIREEIDRLAGKGEYHGRKEQL